MQSMAHGWDSYFHNLPPVSSNPRTLTRTLESEHLETYIEHHDFSDTAVLNEAAASNLNTNYCEIPSIGNSSSDCVYQNYYRETPWQADEEQVLKVYLPSDGNGDLPNLTTDGLSTSTSFPSSFTTDFQELKQDSGMLATPILEDYSDVSSCSDADVGDPRPSCKFMASNPVPKFKPDCTNHHSLEWLFSPTGDTFPTESLCPKISETNSNMKAEKKSIECSHDNVESRDKMESCREQNPLPTSSSIMMSVASETVVERNHCHSCPDQKLETDFLQGKNSDILISGHENVTCSRIADSPEEEEQVSATISRLQDKNGVLKMERTDSDSFKIETFDEQNTLIPNSNQRGDENIQTDSQERDIKTSTQSSYTQGPKASDSKDCTRETEFRVHSTPWKSGHDDESLNEHHSYQNKAQDSISCSTTLMNDCDLNDTSGKKEQHFASHTETCLKPHSMSTDENMHPEMDLTNAADKTDAPFSKDPNHSYSDVSRASLTVDKNVQNVADPPEFSLHLEKSSRDLNPCLENECADPTDGIFTTTTTDLQCIDPAVANEQSHSSNSESCLNRNTSDTAVQNTNPSSSPDLQQSLDQRPLVLSPQSLSEDTDKNVDAPSSEKQLSVDQYALDQQPQSLCEDTDKNVDAPSSPDHQQSVDQCPLAQQPQSLSGDTDKNLDASSSEKQLSVDQCPLAQQPQSLSGDTDKNLDASSSEKQLSVDKCPLAKQPQGLSEATDGNAYAPSSPDHQQSADGSPLTQQPQTLSGDTGENTRESFKETEAPTEEQSVLGMLYSEPLSREHSKLRANQNTKISLGSPDRNTIDYSGQMPQMASSVQLRKHQPVVLLEPLDPVNGMSSLYHCGNCHYKTHSVDDLIEHQTASHFVHNFQFRKTRDLYVLRNEQPEEHLCGVSKESPQLSSESSLKRRSHSTHKCDRCKITFKKLVQYISHMRTHSGKTPYECSECGLYFSQSCSLRRHKRVPGRCKLTNQKITKSESDAITSITQTPTQNNVVHKKSSENLRECYVKLVDVFQTNMCSLCGKYFPTANKLKQHYYNVHKEKNLEASSNQSTTNVSSETVYKVGNERAGKYKCPLCPRIFKYSFNRNRHLRDCVRESIIGSKGKIETGYRCPLCHISFTTSSNRAKHVKHICLRRYLKLLAKENAKSRQNAEQIKKKAEQETQSKKTEQQTQLVENEQKRRATPALSAVQTFPRYKCNLCPAVFYYSSGKYRHMKKHELFKLTGKMFKYRNSVLALSKPQTDGSAKTDESEGNLKLADENSKPSLSCRFCGKHVGLPQSLKKHESSHRGERPYRCLECKKGFKRHCHLMAHKNVHKKRIQCTICKMILPTFGELIQHRSSHGKKGMLQCPDCPLQFQFPVYLRRHLKAHKNKETKPLQNKEQPLSSPPLPPPPSPPPPPQPPQSLESVKKQSVLKQLQCSLCKEIFDDAQVLRKHCLTHITGSSSNQCPFCKHKFSHRRYLVRHMIIHTGDKSFSCTNCGKQFFRHFYLKLHREKCLPAQTQNAAAEESKTKKTYKCSYCPRTFSRKYRVINHHQGHKANSLLLCSKCGQYYGITKLNQHQKDCGVPSESNTDSSNGSVKQSTSQSSLSAHKKPLHFNAPKVLQFKCPHCTQRFQYKSLLLRHLVSHTGVQPYACAHCGQRYRSRTLCLQHAAFCAPANLFSISSDIDMEPQQTESNADYKCHFCTKTFTKPQYLRSHILTHNGVKPYRCKVCDSCFSRYDHLKVHQTHCNGKKQRLEVCIPKITLNDVGKGWQNKFAIESAEKQQKLDCEVCSKSFENQSKLSQHATMYHVRKCFECERCGGSFAHEKYLRKHKKKNKCRKVIIETKAPLPLETNPPTEKVMEPLDLVRNNILERIKPCSNKKSKYVCTYCPRTFGDSRTLLMHIRLHTGEKPYACEHCGERFIRKDYVQRHLAKCTKREQQLTVLCDKCGGFFSGAMLENHKIKCTVKPSVKEANEGKTQQSDSQTPPKGFSCAYCSSRFLLFSQLQEHFVNAHKLETMVTPVSTASLQHHLSNMPNIKEEPLDETYEQLNHSVNVTCNLDTSLDSQFVCPDCNMTFSKKAGLVGHMRVHSKNYPFNCKMCSKGFWNKNFYRSHYRKCKFGHSKERNTTQPLESPLKAQIDFALDDSVLVFNEGSTATGVLQTNFSSKDDTEQSPQHSAVNEVQSKYQCSECDQSFTDGLLLISHLEDHGREEQEKKNNTCSKCGRVFTSQSSLEKHMRCHGITQKFHCPDCSKVFDDLSDLEVHVASHDQNRPYLCKVCNQRFWTRPSLHIHYRAEHPAYTFACPFCSKSFSVKKSLSRHLKKCHPKEQKDLVKQKSGIEQQSSSQVSTADESDEGGKNSEDSDSDSAPYFPCHVCSKTFPTSESLEDHQRCHLGEKPFECEKCGRCFYQASQLQQHQRMHTSEFQCQACGRGFVSLFALRTHKHTHGKSRPYRCSKCDFSFTGLLQLAEHMTTHREENFPCDVCNKVFQSKSSRAEHRKSHSKSDDRPSSSFSRVDHVKSPPPESSSVFTKELKYRCGICNKRFKDPEDLSEHGCMAAKERSYSCLDCDKHFLHASHLKKHRNKHHPSWSSTEYPCNLCNSSFSSPQYFLSHLKTHVDPSIDGLQGKNRQLLQDCICPVCHLCFTGASELIGHFPTHLDGMFECKVCKMTFPTGRELGEHEQCHLPPSTEFQCTECGQTFLGSEAFRQHHCSRQQREKIESKYSNPTVKASPSLYREEAGDEEEVDVTGEDLYNCPSCTMQFSSKSSLLEHQNKQHVNDKPFKCGHCGKTFALRQYLKKHEKRHHAAVVMQSDKSRFGCIQCDSKFDTPHELSLHIRLHEKAEVGAFRCDMCYKSFTHWTLLKRHQESHVGEVVYECTECDKAFAFPHLLEEHQQTHAGSSRETL